MKIIHKLFASYFIISLLIATVFIVSLFGFQNMNNNYKNLLSHSSSALKNLKEVQYYFTGQANDERGLLLQGDKTYEKEIKDKANYVKDKLVELQSQIDTAEDKKLLATISDTHEKFTQINLKVAAQYFDGQKDAAIALSFGEGRTTRKDLTTTFNTLVKSIEDNISLQTKQIEQNSASTKKIIIFVSVLAILLGFITGFMIYRAIVKPLKSINNDLIRIAEGEGDLTNVIHLQSRDEIGDLARSFNAMNAKLRILISSIKNEMGQVAASSQQLKAIAIKTSKESEQISNVMNEVANDAATQLTRTNEGSIALEEMAAGIQRVSVSTQNIASTSMETAKRAEEGNETILQAIIQMKRIHSVIDESSTVVAKLGNRSEEIGDIVYLIKQISSQTNILSLNASIEAARAGEHGRGFSVVANEIRKLAEQTDSSTIKISGLIDEISQETGQAVSAMDLGIKEVQKGLISMNQSEEAFHKILSDVKNISDQMHDVSSISEEMSAISEQVTASNLDSTHFARTSTDHALNVSVQTKNQMTNINEVADLASSLTNVTTEVQDLLGKFKV